MSVDLKQAVKRLRPLLDEELFHHVRILSEQYPNGENAEVLRAFATLLSRAEAERDLLAAECRASRECNACYRYIEHGVGEPRTDEQWESASAALATAMAATDAAGVLKEDAR